MCTVVSRKSPSGESWDPPRMKYGPTQIHLDKIQGTLICHIQGQSRREKTGLTKKEVECMLNGYPPWYRETVTTATNISFPFPIDSLQDIPRGGWIVAVGLMDRTKTDREPLAVYRCPDEPEEPGFRMNGVTFRKAVARCRDRIKNHILPNFPADQDVITAIESLDHLVTERTGSGMPKGRFNEIRMSTTLHLRGSDCRFATSLFNRFAPLSRQEHAKLQTILPVVLAAAVFGAYEVVQYLKDVGVELKIPSDLCWFDEEVYLRDCTTKLPVQ